MKPLSNILVFLMWGAIAVVNVPYFTPAAWAAVGLSTLWAIIMLVCINQQPKRSKCDCLD